MEQKLANPAPLGLMGFGMTTILLNIHNAGFFPVSDVILAMGILFFLLATRNWTVLSWIGKIAGWEGIICGASSVYLAMAELLEETRGKKILPF